VIYREQAEEALVMYKRGNMWKSIFHNVIVQCHVDLVCFPPLANVFLITNTHLSLQEYKLETCVSHADLLARLPAALPDQAQQIDHDQAMIFGEIESENYYLHHYHWWRCYSQVCNFEMHIYTDNKHHGVDILYHQLFCIFTNYIGLSTDKEELFDIFKAYHYATYISSLLLLLLFTNIHVCTDGTSTSVRHCST
jgi:hypothetical protein